MTTETIESCRLNLTKNSIHFVCTESGECEIYMQPTIVHGSHRMDDVTFMVCL